MNNEHIWIGHLNDLSSKTERRIDRNYGSGQWHHNTCVFMFSLVSVIYIRAKECAVGVEIVKAPAWLYLRENTIKIR